MRARRTRGRHCAGYRANPRNRRVARARRPPRATVGGAGTGTFEFESASGVFNEIQPGSYIFMDADDARNRNAAGDAFDTFAPALFVYTTVMSRTDNERAVVDAGHKAAAVDLVCQCH